MRLLGEIAQSNLPTLLRQMQDQFNDLMNIIGQNYNLYLLLEREFTNLFEKVMDKEIKVAYW